ncbi:RNA-directed DNA polymerase, eukaryota, reverse transcriptase zinc-binding domain protein [Tanacetum coccineum]
MEDSNIASNTTWGAILSLVNRLKQKGIDLLSLCVRKIGNGASCHFWEDTWVGHLPLKDQFPRIFQLDSFKSCSIADRLFVQDWDSFLRRHPRGGAEMSQLLDLQSLIQVDSNLLDSSPVATRWNRSIPIKVNVFIWRLTLNKLPSRVNLDRKGLDVGLILCPICMDDAETVNHIFFSCNMAKDLWSLFANWWELDIPFCDNFSEWFEWVDALQTSNKARMIIEGVGGTLLWDMKHGDGKFEEAKDNEVNIDMPDEMLIKDSSDPIALIIYFIYLNMLNNLDDYKYLTEKATRAPTNEVVDTINDQMLFQANKSTTSVTMVFASHKRVQV